MQISYINKKKIFKKMQISYVDNKKIMNYLGTSQTIFTDPGEL